MLTFPLPAEYMAIPILEREQYSSIRICAVVRHEPDAVGGHLVLRRDLLDARVYLGCVCDDRGPVAYVELWVQDLELFADTARTLTLSREALCNAALDERWAREFQTALDGAPHSVLVTGYEKENPPPTLIDVERGVPVHLGPADARWELCRDDELLRSRDLPPYATTLHRYLYQPSVSNSLFAPLSPGSPKNPHTVDLESIWSQGPEVQKFNIGGGLLQVRPMNPTRLEDCVKVLGGAPWNGPSHGRTHVRVGPLLGDGISGMVEGGWLSTGQHHVDPTRFAETLYLKLCLLADMIAEVRRRTETASRPLLNLRPGSFAVTTPSVPHRLPALWSVRAVLTDPGDAIPLKIPLSDARRTYYVPGRSTEMSVYRPREATDTLRGEGIFFPESVGDTPDKGFVVHGTFDVCQRIRVAKNDILFMRVNAAGARVDLYADVDRRNTVSAERLRFHTVGQRLPDTVKRALKQMEGLQIDQTYFEIIPLLNSAVDLYSLGVIAVETLLVNGRMALPRMLNETYELARLLDANQRPGTDALPLPARIANVFNADPRFHEKLGPQWLIHHEIPNAMAREFITDEIWFETLAMLVKMFAGKSRDSICEDYGDAPLDGLHTVYDEIARELDGLLIRVRSLVLVDCGFNRDVTWAIQKVEDEARQMDELSAKATGPAAAAPAPPARPAPAARPAPVPPARTAPTPPPPARRADAGPAVAVSKRDNDGVTRRSDAAWSNHVIRREGESS